MPNGRQDWEGRVLAEITADEIVALAGDLIRLPTVNPPGDEAPAAELLARRLTRDGVPAEVMAHDARRASVAARLAGAGDRPGLILTGHLDVVGAGERAWTRDPFGGQVVDGRLYGRGAADMKGAVAAMAVAAAALRRAGAPLRGDLILALTAGEETDSLGAEALARAGWLRGADALVVGEPTDLEVYVAEKGNLGLRVTTHGRTAHASMPELGQNAIYAMADVVAALESYRFDRPEHPLLGQATLSVGVIRGGVQTNVVPDGCAIEVDVRTLPGQSHEAVRADLQARLDALRARRPGLDARVEVLLGREAVATPADDPLVHDLVAVVADMTGRRPDPGGVTYSTDASVLVPALGVPMAICGPGPRAQAHQTDEHVPVEALLRAARVYALLALRRLS